METGALVSILAIVGLLVLSAFFSGSETALTAASRARIQALARRGERRATRVKRLREHKERLIGAILLANNLVNILASALATSLLIAAAGDSGVAYATVIMTLLVLIFAEVLPKTYAINNADRMALAVAGPVRWLVAVLYPFTHTVQTIVRGTLRLFGVDAHADLGMTVSEELRGAIDLHASAEEVKHERAMLRSILDLEQVEVGEIMTHRKDVIMIDAGQKPSVVVEQILASPYTRLPLWRGEPDNIIGVLHAKTLLKAVNEHQGDVDAIDIVGLAAEPWFIPESTTLIRQLQAFRQQREHVALVVDEYGAFMGIVTLEDILEEIVGDIADEYDEIAPGIRAQPDGSYIVAGATTIRDLNRQFDWPLPDEEAATIAGLVLHEARQIPDVGQVFNFYGFRFEILRRKRNQITSLRITPPRRPAAADAG